MYIDKIRIEERGTYENPYPCVVIYGRDESEPDRIFYRAEMCGYEEDEFEEALNQLLHDLGASIEEIDKAEWEREVRR